MPVPGSRRKANDATASRRELLECGGLPPLFLRRRRYRKRHRVSLRNISRGASRAEPPVGPSPDGKSVLARESLGNSVVENLSVVGTRETLTTAAGAVCNTQPLVSTREFWYSPELQINVSVTRQSPTEGTQAIQLLEVSRSDPDPALFQIPAEYQIHAHRSTPDPSIGGR